MTFVYVSNADSQEIYVMALGERDGAATVVQQAAVPGKVMPLAIGPTRRFLYAGLRSNPFSVSTLAIDQTSGELRPLSSAPLPDNMAYLSTDRTGRFLFGASYGGDSISINRIDTDGTVLAPPVQVVATPPHPHSILVDPTNMYVLVPCLGGDAILLYRFDPVSGQVAPNTPRAVNTGPGSGPRHLVFHPNGRFAYCTNELDATVDAYRFDAATGTLTTIGTANLLPPDFKGGPPYAAADLHVTPNGRFLYASERASNTLAIFMVDAESGALTPAGSVPTERQPRGFNVDPSGRCLLAVGQQSNSMTSYAIDEHTGALTPRHRYPVGKNPNWVEIIDLT